MTTSSRHTSDDQLLCCGRRSDSDEHLVICINYAAPLKAAELRAVRALLSAVANAPFSNDILFSTIRSGPAVGIPDNPPTALQVSATEKRINHHADLADLRAAAEIVRRRGYDALCIDLSVAIHEIEMAGDQ